MIVSSNDPHEQEAHNLVRQFLAELDACTSEQERINKVLELVFGVTRAARKEQSKEQGILK